MYILQSNKTVYGKAMLWHSLLLLFYFLLPAHSVAQKYNFINYNVENGLAQSQVVCMIQDKNSELWLGTYGGISRFDGSNFTSYNKANGLPNNLISALAYGKDGSIWIGSPGRVTRYDGRKFSSFAIPESRAGETGAAELRVDRAGTVWARSGMGLYFFQQQQFIKEQQLDTVSAMTLSPEGDLLVARFRKGVYKRHQDKWTLFSEADAQKQVIIGMTLGRQSKKIYCATLEGIKILEGNHLNPPDWFPPVPFMMETTEVFEDSQGNIWLNMADGGAWKYREGKWEHYSFKNGLTDDIVNGFFEDREGNIWIATNGSGIFRFSGNIFTYYDRSTGLASGSVMSIGEDRHSGNLYFGTSSAGLYTLSDGGVKQETFLPYYDNISCIKEGSDGNLWMGSGDAGLWVYNGKKAVPVLTEEGTPVFRIFALCSTDNAIWLSGWRGLMKVQDHKAVPVGLSLRNIHAIFFAGGDSLLLGTLQGAYVYHISTGRLADKPLLAGANVLCFAADAQKIYIGTDDRGVVVFDRGNGSTKSINAKQGLSCDYVYSLLRDQRGDIWAGTGCGIDRLSFSEGQAKIKSFGRSDGLLGVENNANASFEDSHGYLWFGTTKGVFRFDPSAAPRANFAPLVVLQSVKLFSRNVPEGVYADSVTAFAHLPWQPVFAPGQNHLTFSFKGVYLSNPEKVRYRYQLIGADKTFTETDQTTVIYPGLPAGDYTFKVWASDGAGNWYNNAASYSFTIKAPFYKTAYFIVGMVLLGIGLLLAAVYYRNRQRTLRLRWEQQLREEEQARVRQRTAEDFHDEIGNKLTRINLLATIAEGKMRDKEEDLQRLMKQIQGNVTSLYNGSKDIIWSLQPYSDFLDEIILRIRQNATEMLQGSAIKFHYAGPDENGENLDLKNTHIQLPIDYSRNLIMIFKEAINNTAKHSGAGIITFSVKWMGDHRIVLELSDNGSGFDEATINKGNGLNNMRNRATRIGALLTLEGVPGKGTRLRLELPL